MVCQLWIHPSYFAVWSRGEALQTIFLLCTWPYLALPIQSARKSLGNWYRKKGCAPLYMLTILTLFAIFTLAYFCISAPSLLQQLSVPEAAVNFNSQFPQTFGFLFRGLCSPSGSLLWVQTKQYPLSSTF